MDFCCSWPYCGPIGRCLRLLATKLLENEDFSYGLLLPLVSGYLVYLKWPQIRNLSLQPAWQGFIFLALGMLLYIVGEASTDLYSPSLSFVVSLSGILILLGGWNLIRLLWFPLFLLVMTIPLPNFLFQKLTFPLQMISSWMATGILQAIGIPAVRQGNVIDLGARQLQVVSACSGLRYILSLLALGMIFCYFYQRRPWKVVTLAGVCNSGRNHCQCLARGRHGNFPDSSTRWFLAYFLWLAHFCLLLCIALSIQLGTFLGSGQNSGEH